MKQHIFSFMICGLLLSFMGIMYSVQPYPAERSCFAVQKASVDSPIVEYDEQYSFQDGVVTALENERGISYMEKFTDDSFAAGTDLSEVAQYIKDTYGDCFTCQVEDNETVYTNVPLEISFDINEMNLTEPGDTTLTLTLIAPENVLFSQGVKKTIVLKYSLRELYDEPIEIDTIPNLLYYTKNWVFPVNCEDDFYCGTYENDGKSLYNLILERVSYIYGDSTAVSLYDYVNLELVSCDFSNVKFDQVGRYTVTVSLDVQEESRDQYYLSSGLKTFSFDLYIVDPLEYQLCFISTGLNDQILLECYMNKLKEGTLYYAYSDTDCIDGDVDELIFTACDDDVVSYDLSHDKEKITVNSDGFKKGYHYFYISDGEQKTNVVGFDYQGRVCYEGEISGNRDGGDINDTVTFIPNGNGGDDYSYAADTDAEIDKNTMTEAVSGTVSPSTGTYIASFNGATVSLGTEVSRKISALGKKISLHIKQGGIQSISIKAMAEDETIQSIPNTKVYFPYTPKDKKAKIIVKDQDQNVVTEAAYNEAQATTDFSVDKSGTYVIEEQGQNGQEKTTVIRYVIGTLALFVVLAAFVVLMCIRLKNKDGNSEK